MQEKIISIFGPVTISAWAVDDAMVEMHVDGVDFLPPDFFDGVPPALDSVSLTALYDRLFVYAVRMGWNILKPYIQK